MWLETLYFEDEMEAESQRAWFKGYLHKTVPSRVEFIVQNVSLSPDEINAACTLIFTYEQFDQLKDEHIYTMRYVECEGEWKVVTINKSWLPFGTAEINPVLYSDYSTADPFWWSNESELELVRNSSDPLPANLYARAIPRNIRSREVHSDLECAAVLSNMLSLRTADLAALLIRPNDLQTLEALYHFASKNINFQIERPDRNSSWSSKFTAPTFSFDELLAMAGGHFPLTANCTPVMSLYFAVLRLCGYAASDIVQLRLVNYDCLLVSISGEAHLFFTDRIVKLNAGTFYYQNEISKLFNEREYWSAAGNSSLSSQMADRLNSWFGEDVVFKFSHPLTTGNGGDKSDCPMPSLRDCADPLELHGLLRQAILKYSCDLPDSVYTYAKYAYQTILVKKPQAYVLASMNSPVIRQFLSDYDTKERFFEYVSLLKKKSIFREYDRLMTADQVIRHGTGDPASLSVLVFVWLNLSCRSHGGVCVTDEDSYCCFDGEIWSGKKRKNVSEIQGNLLVAFNHESCFSELMNMYEAKDDGWITFIRQRMNVS
ncbi:hypothetical protein ACE6ED_14780 [Paenibacillus sp. CN-4]